MNPLRGSRCYLSGPIEFEDGMEKNWREEPKQVLRTKFGIDVFDPYADPKQQWAPALREARDRKDFETMARIARDFVKKDLKKVDRSDFLVAYLPKGLATTGTHHEIINSVNMKDPTLLVCPQGKEHVPLWYYGFIPHEFMFGNWEDLYAYLEEVDKGKHTDNNRWVFLYDLI